VLLHLLGFSIVLRTHGSGKASARVERSGDRLRIAQTMLLDEMGDELALADGKVTLGAISVDFYAQQLCGGSRSRSLKCW
jgi:hypothetical protein